MPAPPSDHGAPEPDPLAHREELLALYAALDAEVREAGPVCELSGRCCRFAEYGHTLFLSAPEFTLLRADAPPPVRPLDDGATCPWQDHAGRCTARAARPLGCRVYYCDPTYQDRAGELSELYISRLKDLADRHGLAWDYAPLHRHLHRAAHDETIAEPAHVRAFAETPQASSPLTLVHATTTVEPTEAGSDDFAAGESPL